MREEKIFELSVSVIEVWAELYSMREEGKPECKSESVQICDQEKQTVVGLKVGILDAEEKK